MTSWLENMGKLLSDRNEEVRKVATYSLEHFFKHVDERMVLAYITSSSSTQQAVLKRALHSAVPDLGQRLLAFQREDGFRQAMQMRPDLPHIPRMAKKCVPCMQSRWRALCVGCGAGSPCEPSGKDWPQALRRVRGPRGIQE